MNNNAKIYVANQIAFLTKMQEWVLEQPWPGLLAVAKWYILYRIFVEQRQLEALKPTIVEVGFVNDGG